MDVPLINGTLDIKSFVTYSQVQEFVFIVYFILKVVAIVEDTQFPFY